MFVKLYIRNSGDELATIRSLDNAFQAAYIPSNMYTEDFLGRVAINVASAAPPGRSLDDKTVSDSVHPGCDRENCPEGDPTLLAVVIGTYVGMYIIIVLYPPEDKPPVNDWRGELFSNMASLKYKPTSGG